MSTELKPCPFCGGFPGDIDDEFVRDGVYFIVCGNCAACGPGEASRERAVEVWNERKASLGMKAECIRELEERIRAIEGGGR